MGVQGIAATHGAPSSAASFAPTMPAHQAGDLLLLIVGGKYNTASVPTIDQGWTRLNDGSGGTGSAGNDTGTVASVVFAKIAASSSEPAPTVTAGATPYNSWAWMLGTYRPQAGYQWRDQLSVGNGMVQFGSDLSTASPLAATASVAWSSTSPTNGDGVVFFGIIPTDLGTGLSALSITLPGVTSSSDPTIGAVYRENALGTDMTLVGAFTTDIVGTVNNKPSASFTVTSATNQSGMIGFIALRQQPTPVASGGLASLELTATGGAAGEGSSGTPFSLHEGDGVLTPITSVGLHEGAGMMVPLGVN